MKISGFTIIRNGVQFDYPFEESLHSLLPVVDELVINVGVSDDETLDKIKQISKKTGQGKIRILESHWPLNDPEKKRGGKILSEQTNLALDQCKGDWAIYLQADEVLHEIDYPKIIHSLNAANSRSDIDGLLFDYVHFYGSFDVVHHSRSTYRREVRAVRIKSGARSVGDAQSFRGKDGKKLAVLHSGAKVYHYGWVRTPEAMKEKTFFMDQLYHGDPTREQNEGKIPHTGDNYRYKRFWGLTRFTGTHPKIMEHRISRKGWSWDLKTSPFVWKTRDTKRVFLDIVEKFTGYRLFEYRSYRLRGKV